MLRGGEDGGVKRAFCLFFVVLILFFFCFSFSFCLLVLVWFDVFKFSFGEALQGGGEDMAGLGGEPNWDA